MLAFEGHTIVNKRALAASIDVVNVRLHHDWLICSMSVQSAPKGTFPDLEGTLSVSPVSSVMTETFPALERALSLQSAQPSPL